MTREFIALNGRIWWVRRRADVRKGEIGTHVTLEFISDDQIRVVSCPMDEWDIPEPDFAALLARSVVSGASRAHRP
jgi:hypothetical protein